MDGDTFNNRVRFQLRLPDNLIRDLMKNGLVYYLPDDFDEEVARQVLHIANAGRLDLIHDQNQHNRLTISYIYECLRQGVPLPAPTQPTAITPSYPQVPGYAVPNTPMMATPGQFPLPNIPQFSGTQPIIVVINNTPAANGPTATQPYTINTAPTSASAPPGYEYVVEEVAGVQDGSSGWLSETPGWVWGIVVTMIILSVAFVLFRGEIMSMLGF